MSLPTEQWSVPNSCVTIVTMPMCSLCPMCERFLQVFGLCIGLLQAAAPKTAAFTATLQLWMVSMLDRTQDGRQGVVCQQTECMLVWGRGSAASTIVRQQMAASTGTAAVAPDLPTSCACWHPGEQ
jgi:hypothetical protein